MAVYSFEHPAVERRAARELEAGSLRQQMLSAQMSPDLGQRLVALHQTWPDIPPGALMAMAMADIDPTSDVARRIEERAFEAQRGLGFAAPGEVVQAEQIEREQQNRQAASGESTPFRYLKNTVRGAMFGMQSAFDEVSRRATAGLVALQDPDMDYGEAMELSTPSQAALVATDEFGFEDLGEGFLPGGAVRERQEELKQRLTLEGEWMSPGRALTINIAEPGTKPFNFVSGLLDAGFNILGDPATYATAGVGKLAQANRAFATNSALIRGIRGVPDETFARQWWQGSKVGNRLREQLVEASDPYEVWRRLGGDKGKVDRETARLIAEATDIETLDSVVLPRLGPQGIAEKPVGGMVSRNIAGLFGDDIGSVHGIGYRVRRAADNVRLLNWMPRESGISVGDPDETILNLHRFMRGINATDEEAAPIMQRAFRMGVDDAPAARAPHGIDVEAVEQSVGLTDITGMTKALDGTPVETVADNWMELAKSVNELAVGKALRDSVGDRTGAMAAKTEQRIRQSIGRVVERREKELTAYFTREAGRPRSHVPTIIDGEDVDFSQVPHLVTEYLSRSLPLPDPKELRRHIGTYANVMRIMQDIPRGPWEGTVDLAEGFMSTLWKPLTLLRAAYITRVQPEEQLRMAATGLDSAFRHPVSYFAYLSGRRGGVGIADDPIRDMAEYHAIAQHKGGGFIGRRVGEVGTGDHVRRQRFDSAGNAIDDVAFARTVANDLSFLINDEVSGIVARMGVNEAKEYLASAKGAKLRQTVGSARHNGAVAHSRQALDDYVDTVWMRIEEKTRGIAALIDAIATGRLDGKVVRWSGPGKGDSPTNLQKWVRGHLDELGITEASGPRFITTTRKGSSAHNLLDQYNSAVDVLADIVMSKPTNILSRQPTWNQEYVRAVESTLGFMDEGMQQATIRWAREKANLSRSQVARMERTAAAGKGTAITDVETMDLLARGIATRKTQKLLYELTEQGQFSDAMRAAMPFAEAWKEILVTWSRIIKESPQTVRRGQQVIEGARGSGFFYTDPTTGEETFAYPGGHFVSRALLAGYADSAPMQAALTTPGVGALATVGLGVAGAMMGPQQTEADLTGSVAGLNLIAGSVMPGFGPAVTVPAAVILPNTPSTEWVRDNVLFPFGEPDVEGGVFESLMPAWMQKFRTAFLEDPERDRVYANSVFDVAKALIATGEFSTSSPEENERLLATAMERAKGLWLVRGASQFVVPTGPSASFRTQDLDGQWWPYQVLASEFHRLSREHGEQEAIEEFIGTFGTDLIAMVQSKSREVVTRPVDKVGDDWITANPSLVNAYPATVGLVAPEDATGEFDYSAYQRQFEEGTREQLTPQQMVWLSNNLLGRFAYAQAVETIEATAPSTEDARIAKAAAKAQLMERFPGFSSHLGLSERPRFEQQLVELEAMVADPRLADNPAVEAARQYLATRQKAQQAVALTAKRSTSFKSSAETAPIRAWLRSEAERLTKQTPEFTMLWERVFSRELADDEVAEPGQIGA